MNFFAHQDRARRNTKVLLGLFALAIFAIMAVIYFVAVPFHNMMNPVQLVAQSASGQRWWHPRLACQVVFAVSCIIAGGSLYMIHKLKHGGRAVAEMLGGRPASFDSEQIEERRLLNVVEEMSIASGTPMPAVYIMDYEEGINAFAAGFSPSDTAIGVTRGCITKLSRDELQGVIAHEFSHILNGDMRLNIKLTGILHGILCISTIGYWMLRGMRSGRGRGGLYFILIGLAMWIVGYIGVFFGNLIKSSVSRRREFLADASAVQFTRNPQGISNALKKIGSYSQHSEIQSPFAQAASHMFFSNAIKHSFLGILASHPPLNERIKRLDPSFKGSPLRNQVNPTGAQSLAMGVSYAAATGSNTMSTNGKLTEQIGNPTQKHLEYAHHFIDSLDPKLASARKNPHCAKAVIYILLLDPETSIKEKQLEIIQADSPDLVAKVTELEPLVFKLGHSARLSLVDLTLNALRRATNEDYHRFNTTISKLIKADGKISLFEFILGKILKRHLAPYFVTVDKQNVKFRSFGDIRNDVRHILSVLAYSGHTNIDEAKKAFHDGFRCLTSEETELLDSKQLSLKHLDQAFNRLEHSSPSIKREVIDAVVATIASDGQTTAKEAELLRCIGDAIDCPIPPMHVN